MFFITVYEFCTFLSNCVILDLNFKSVFSKVCKNFFY